MGGTWVAAALPWLFLIMVFFALKALSQDTREWVRIDCGDGYPFGGWQPDDPFIKTGENKGVSADSYTGLDSLNTLRAFTQQNKNCYTLPTPKPARYFIRAAFYYGNYDGLWKPPTFDLQIDGNKWATVETSLTDMNHYYELVYKNRGDSISVCLARTFHAHFPFISSLEMLPLPDDVYPELTNDTTWSNTYRYNYGATDWIFGYFDDGYNRFWEPANPSGLARVEADFNSLLYTTVEKPAQSAILDAVEAQNPTDTISLSFGLSKTNTLNDVVLYFTEVDSTANGTRSFDIYVNDDFLANIRPQYQNCTGVWTIKAPTASDLINVELRPTADSLLPPVISAIEVYTARDPPMLTVRTSQDDVDGLGALTSSFEQIEGWSGDPCLPNDTIWQWVNCTGNDPPRVTSLNLTGYGLNGSLPDFHQMQALETIDLGNNSINGPIPEFLGKLPNLKLLNLSYNNFSGHVPPSIRKNKKLKYQIKGNPDLHHPKGKNIGLIIGLSFGLPAGLLLAFCLFYFFARKRSAARQGKVTLGLATNQGNGTAQGKPQDGNANSTVAGSVNHPSAALDRKELDELIQLQYGNTATRGRA